MALSPGFQTTAFNNTTLTTYTFSGIAIGPVTPDRVVVLLVFLDQGANSKTVTATLDCGDGNGAVAMQSVVQGFDSSETAAIFKLACPNGLTTGTFVITGSGSSGNCQIASYAMTGNPTPPVLDSGTSTATNPAKTLTTQVGGVSFAVGGTRGATSWTPTNIGEDADFQSNNGGTIATMCADSAQDNGTSRAVTLTPAASNIPIGAFASFGFMAPDMNSMGMGCLP